MGAPAARRLHQVGDAAVLQHLDALEVRWYWIVDPELRTFEVLELEASGRYAHAVSMSEGRVTEVPGCEGLVVDLDALWAEADQLEGEEGDERDEGALR